MVKRNYAIEDIPVELIAYTDRYIKTVIKNAKSRFYRNKTRFKKYGLVFVDLDKYAENLRYDEPGFEQAFDETIDVADIQISVLDPELANAIRGLTETQKLVLLKHEILNVPIKQIAIELGISIRMVEKHKHNAIQALKRRMTIDGKE